jgi:hypothetical protein
VVQVGCSLVLLLVAIALAGLLAERVEKPLERRLRGRIGRSTIEELEPRPEPRELALATGR